MTMHWFPKAISEPPPAPPAPPAPHAAIHITDEERAALHWFAHYGLPEHRAVTLRKMLERLK